MAKSLDLGTAFLVKGEMDTVSEGPVFTVQRNCFLQPTATDDTEQTLKENKWSYIKHNNNFYILGEDAIKLKNLYTTNIKDESIIATKIGELRRPMKDGVLNTGEEKLSVAIIQTMIKNLVGKPSYPGEVLCFCAPGDAVDRNITALFHKTMMTNFLKGLGYTVECIPEALAIIFSERPVANDPNEGEMPFTGISMSFGGGMCNVTLAIKKLPLINFSIAKSGDFIDIESAKIAGCDVAQISRFKETKLNLANIDYSEMKEAALDIFYQNVIEHSLNNFASKFNQLDTKLDYPLEICVAGGTAMVPGFIDKFKAVLSSISLPFQVKSVRLASNPFYTVSNGCLLKAISVEKKLKAESGKN